MQLRGARSNNVLAEQEDGVPASASHLARVSTASHLPSSFSDQRKEEPSRSSTDWWDERVARACCARSSTCYAFYRYVIYVRAHVRVAE